MTSTAALVPGHFLTTQNTSPRGSNRITNEAKCECGHLLKWETRDEDHTRHVLAVVWADGFTAGGDEQINLYWDATSLNQPNPWEN